jgi:hypothetical protein
LEHVAQKRIITCLGTMIVGARVEETGDTEKFSLASETTKVLLRLLGGSEAVTNGKLRRLATTQQVN